MTHKRDSEITRRTFCNRALLTSAGVMISATAVSSQNNQQQTLLGYPPMKIDGAEQVMPGSHPYATCCPR